MKQYKATFEYIQNWKSEKITGDYVLNVSANNIAMAIPVAIKQLADFLKLKYSRNNIIVAFQSESDVKLVIKGKAVIIATLYDIGEV